MRSLCAFALLIGVILSPAASAQDQLVLVSKPMSVCTVPQGDKWTIEEVRTAVQEAIKRDPTLDEYFIVHVVNYTGGALVIGTQQWYLFHEGWRYPAKPAWLIDPGVGNRYKEQRIFGAHSAGIVYVHRNVQGLTEADATTAINGQDNVVLISAATKEPLVDGPNKTKVVRAFGDLAGLKYKIAITKKIPAPVQDIQAIADLGFGGQGQPVPREVTPVPLTLCAGDVFEVSPLPSDMVVSAIIGTGDKEKEVSKQTYDNEKKYRYDFSFTLPLKSFKEIIYDKTNGVVSAKEVKKEALFATINLSPVPFDTKRPQLQLIPRIIYGLPITGKPLQHHLLGAAFGLNRAQAYVGVLFNRADQPEGNTLPTNAKWEHDLSFGLNIPVQSVVAALKPKK